MKANFRAICSTQNLLSIYELVQQKVFWLNLVSYRVNSLENWAIELLTTLNWALIMAFPSSRILCNIRSKHPNFQMRIHLTHLHEVLLPFQHKEIKAISVHVYKTHYSGPCSSISGLIQAKVTLNSLIPSWYITVLLFAKIRGKMLLKSIWHSMLLKYCCDIYQSWNIQLST